ncbi:MAG: helix-turn-helix transcriptional regulator [Bacteroidota bacterium]
MSILFSSTPQLHFHHHSHSRSDMPLAPGCNAGYYINDTIEMLVQINTEPIFHSYGVRVTQQSRLSFHTTSMLVALVYQVDGPAVAVVEGALSSPPPKGHYQLLALQPNEHHAVQLEAGTYSTFLLDIDSRWLAALNGEHPVIESFLTRVTSGQKGAWMLPSFRMNKKIDRLINEILHCDKEKMTRVSFLTERATALINMFLKDVSNYYQVQTQLEKSLDEPAGIDTYLEKMINGDESDYLSIGRIIEKLAQQLRLPEYAVRKKFAAIHRTTLYHHIKLLRMQKIAMLLSTTSKPVSEIAWLSGYEDFSSFTRAFSQHFKMTPSQYRVKHSGV